MKDSMKSEEESSTEAPLRQLSRSFAKDFALSLLCFCAVCVLLVFWLDLNVDGVVNIASSSVDSSTHRNLESLSFPSQAGLGLNGKFHQSSLGGILNPNHPAGARARRHLSQTNVIVPKSPTTNAVQSLSEENIMNLHGHYAHDEHRSPFASFLYNHTKEELDQEQKEYIEKMNKVRQEWGAWDFNDEHPEIRPIANFEKTPYKDLPNSQFPSNAWQMDQKYVTDFISEAKKLVTRVREGVYAEYGYATKDLSEEELKERDELFKVHIQEETKPPEGMRDNMTGGKGVAWMNQKGMEIYAKKLVHAMMTNDEFYYVMGGHSSATGHGNNQLQSYMMQLAEIMEPVMHRLGVRLIVRNLAMGGLGTTHFSLGASTLYGETDVMYWDSSMTEKGCEDQDLNHKQNLLGGERYPVLLNGCIANLEEETEGNLAYGNLMGTWGGNPLVKTTTSLDQGASLPWAVQYLKCDPSVGGLCNGKEGISWYHSSCWEPRSDYTPTKKQAPFVGGRASWHPGARVHKFHGRTHTILMLKALDEALNLWENGIQSEGFPLKESYWHIKPINGDMKETLFKNLNKEDYKGTTACEKRWSTHAFQAIGLDRACRRPFKGMGQFTPVAGGYHNSVVKHVKPAPNGYIPTHGMEPVYQGVDVLPLMWKIPKGEVDVHAIAIASTYAPSELDQSWTGKGDDDNEEEAEASRRYLRQAARETIKKRADHKLNAILDSMKNSRSLGPDDIKPGQGWVVNDGVVTGYCDGSPHSGDCKRAPTNDCLLSGQNDAREQVAGNALSGWLVVNVPDVKTGFIFAKIQWWAPRSIEKTIEWTEVNGGMDGYRERGLKRAPTDIPEDFEVDIAVNGEISVTYNYTEWKGFALNQYAYNEAFFPMVNDTSIIGDVELGIRVRSEINKQYASFGVTHIYWD